MTLQQPFEDLEVALQLEKELKIEKIRDREISAQRDGSDDAVVARDVIIALVNNIIKRTMEKQKKRTQFRLRDVYTVINYIIWNVIPPDQRTTKKKHRGRFNRNLQTERNSRLSPHGICTLV